MAGSPHIARGYPVRAARLTRLQDPQIARLARVFLRERCSNYRELIAGQSPREADAIRAKVDRAIVARFPGLKPPEW